MNKNYNNNIFIIASRALFQQSPTCTRVNNLVYIWQQSHTHGTKVMIMFCTWKRFSQWICDIQIYMYFAILQISICYIISDYMKLAVDMLGLWMIFGSLASAMAPVLSHNISSGSNALGTTPSSVMKFLIQTPSLDSSTVDPAITLCLHLLQLTAPPFKI